MRVVVDHHVALDDACWNLGQVDVIGLTLLAVKLIACVIEDVRDLVREALGRPSHGTECVLKRGA